MTDKKVQIQYYKYGEDIIDESRVKAFGKNDVTDDTPDDICNFLAAVNNAYYDFDVDRQLMERSIEISSKEYAENINKINMLQAQLIHQEKMAGIGQLSAGIAHEINNPLGYILSNLISSM